jgi:hypothetical protein
MKLQSSKGFLFYEMIRNGILTSVEWLKTEFRTFYVTRNRRNSDGMNKNFHLFLCSAEKFFSQKMAALVCPEHLDSSYHVLLFAALQPVKNGTKGQASPETSTSRGTMAMLFFVQHTLKMLCVYDMPREESAAACWVLPSLTKDLTEWATMEVMYANPFRVS